MYFYLVCDTLVRYRHCPKVSGEIVLGEPVKVYECLPLCKRYKQKGCCEYQYDWVWDTYGETQISRKDLPPFFSEKK